MTIVGEDGDFLIDAEGRHFWARHLAPVDSVEPDFVAVAELFLQRALSLGRAHLGGDRLFRA